MNTTNEKVATELKRLLDDCYETFNWIIESEIWDSIKEIDNFINNHLTKTK